MARVRKTVVIYDGDPNENKNGVVGCVVLAVIGLFLMWATGCLK
jgi:hypothetical protein